MTREEEIKEKLETYLAKYIHWQSGRQLDNAEDDIEYLLARNEELQRRVKLLEKVYERARDLLYDGIYGGEYYDSLLDTVARDRSTGKNTRAVALFDALTPLEDAKAQNDDD